jgi:DNA-binding Lrp family transcriptional regulator
MSKQKKKQKLTDERLLDAMVRLGGKVTATELGQVLGVPDRTIRYRIQRLREKGLIGRVWPQTFDAKIGLGDGSLILDMSERFQNLPREFLFCFPNFYANYATFGKYNGCQTGFGYPLGSSQMIERIVRVLKQKNIIKNSYMFMINDFISLAADVSKYNSATGWNWDWQDWVKVCEKTIKAGERFPFEFDTNPAPFPYDHKDIEIIAEIKMYGGRLTHKEISKRVNLSETQIGVRLRRLTEAGVLRGYIWLTEQTPRTVILFTHMELDDPDPVLSCFLHLPFRREILMDSVDKVAVRLTMNSSDIGPYLKGFEALRPYIRSYFIQTAVGIKVVPGGMHGFYHLHNESTGKWEIPEKESIERLEKFIEDY